MPPVSHDEKTIVVGFHCHLYRVVCISDIILQELVVQGQDLVK